MPIIVVVDHQLQKTSATAIGEITMADIRSHLDEEDTLRGLGYREFIDASGATTTVSSVEIRQIVAILEDLGREGALGATAIIVSDDMAYGMLRMLGMLLYDVCELLPFRASERAKAEEWLAAKPITAAK